MSKTEIHAEAQILGRIRVQAEQEALRLTRHAQEEMVEEDILIDDLLQALEAPVLLENYPDHRRGACCLVCGYTGSRRPLHTVCTTAEALLIIITVYEPMLPKWISPTERRSS